MKQINESFTCLWCGKVVEAAPTSCRNHCPYCFLSLHVDKDIPGDRATDCHGYMVPREYEIANWMTKITFVCTKCFALHRNKSALDDAMGHLDASIKKRKKIYPESYV